MLNNLIDQMNGDKYRALSSNLESLISLQEYSDRGQIIKDAIEYIDLLENVIIQIDAVMEGIADKMKEVNEKKEKDISQLVFRWELLKVRANKELEKGESSKSYYRVREEMDKIEYELRTKYNYYIDVEDES